MANTREFQRQQIGGVDPHENEERDQCGYCGGWYTVTVNSVYGACSLHDNVGIGPERYE